jgi:PAS domain S-box-containing protein
VGLVWRQQQSRFYRAQYESAEALRRSETRFHTLYDSTRDAVMLLDTKGFFDCNPATLTMFGCATREEFCSKHPADVSPPMQPDGTDSRTQANQRIDTALEKGSNHFEWMHKRVDTGGIFPTEVLLSAMKLDGKPVLQVVVRDITERKQNEAERDKLIQDLLEALANVKSLSGLLPICASCKKIRDDKGYWSKVESYIQSHSDATFTHGLCPDCIKKYYAEMDKDIPDKT